MFIGYNTSAAVILGGTQSNIDRFSKTVLLENGNPHNFTGKYVIDNAVEIGTLADATNGLGNVKAEVVTSYELGYRYNSPKFTIDISAYMSNYVDKIAGKFVLVPVMTSAFNTPAAAVELTVIILSKLIQILMMNSKLLGLILNLLLH